MFRRSLAAAALCVWVLGAPPALAQTPEEPSAADVESARNAMDVGRDKYDKGEWQAAYEAFKGADAIMHVTSTGLWLGKSLMQLGRLIEARDKLYEVSQIPVAPGESEIITAAREEAEKLQFEIADRIPEMTLVLEGLPEGTEVAVQIDGDDVPPETVKLPRKVDPGAHQVIAFAPGFEKVQRTVEVAEAARETVTLTFEPGGPAPDPAAASPPGPDEAEEGGMSPLFWTGVGVTGLGVLVGSITGGLSLSAASEAKEGCVDTRCVRAPDGSNEDAADRSVLMGHVSTAGFAVAGAGAALAIVGLVVSTGGDGDEPAAATFQPLAGPGFIGVRGSF